MTAQTEADPTGSYRRRLLRGVAALLVISLASYVALMDYTGGADGRADGSGAAIFGEAILDEGHRVPRPCWVLATGEPCAAPGERRDSLEWSTEGAPLPADTLDVPLLPPPLATPR
jgi:hypothetical protein